MSATEARSRIESIVKGYDADTSYEDLLRDLAFDRLVLRGLRSISEPRLTTDEVRLRVKTWQG